jgi:hypothetical protein
VEDALYGRNEEKQETEMKTMLQTKEKNRNKTGTGRKKNAENFKTEKK